MSEQQSQGYATNVDCVGRTAEGLHGQVQSRDHLPAKDPTETNLGPELAIHVCQVPLSVKQCLMYDVTTGAKFGVSTHTSQGSIAVGV